MAVNSSDYCFIATLGLVLISLLLDGTTIATVEWLVNKSYGLYRGLWKECNELGKKEQCFNIGRTSVENTAISFLTLAMIFKSGVCTSLIFFRRYKRSRIFITVLDFVAGVWNVIAVTVYGAKYPTFSGGETAEFGLSFRLAIGSIAMTFLICPILWLILKPKNAQSGYLTDRDTNANQQPIDMELVGNSFVRSAYAF